MAPQITIYSTKYCGYCRAAEDLLRRHGVDFRVVDVTYDRETRADLVERAQGRRTVPVIFLGEDIIGGYRELAALMASGELMRRLGRSAAGPSRASPAND